MGSALMEVLATRDFAEVPLLLSPPRPAGEGSIHPVHGHSHCLSGFHVSFCPGSRLDNKLDGDPTHWHSSTLASSADWIIVRASQKTPCLQSGSILMGLLFCCK